MWALLLKTSKPNMKNTPPEQARDAQTLLNQLILDYRQEQKRKRQWRWIKRAILLILIVFIYFKITSFTEEEKSEAKGPHAGLIDLKGNMFDTSSGGNAEHFAKGLDAAYKAKGLKALIIRINSPGGSPVQADYMFNTLQYYRSTYPKVKIYAVCTDICTSAAYYVAAAADEIYANPSSIVGSIGVLYNGFGFVDAMQKIGVERRLQTAGRYKALLDPFTREDPYAKTMLQNMLQSVHQEFINKVKLGRGSRLIVDEDTFSGLFWTGEQAKTRGLIDGFASSGQLAREQLHLETIDYTYQQSVLERMTKGVGLALAEALPQALNLESGFR